MKTARSDTVTEVKGGTLEVVDLHASYGEIQVLHGLSFTLRAGSVLALLGANGAGKTTALRAISGHLRAQLRITEGDVLYDGDSIKTRQSDVLAKRGICLIPEGRGVFPNLTVSENLEMWTHAQRLGRAQIETIAFEHFPVLATRRKQLAGTLSGGEQQMLALSRALSTGPRVLLLDELSMGLAPALVDALYEVVSGISKAGTSVLIVEQSIATALSVADEVGLMARGRLERIGAPTEVADEALDLYLS